MPKAPAPKASYPCLLTAAGIFLVMNCTTPLHGQVPSTSPRLAKPSGSELSTAKSSQKANSHVLVAAMGKAAHSVGHGLASVLPPNKLFHRTHRSLDPAPKLNYSASSHPILSLTSPFEPEVPPDIASEVSSVPPPFEISPSEPAKPHRPQPVPEAVPSEEQVALEITPALTSKEIERAKRETLGDLERTERILTLARGRALNATERDLISKAHDFAENAREAARTGDWERARILAQKARVLSSSL